MLLGDAGLAKKAIFCYTGRSRSAMMSRAKDSGTDGINSAGNTHAAARINTVTLAQRARVMDEMKANIAAAETRIKQSQDGFNAYMSER